MSYAHCRGVIHRDLKPSNILVTDDGVPYVVDFGLAKVLDLKPETGLVSESGRLLGTLHYMAPEQTGGNPDAIDTRTDVYALAVILYEMLTDSPPYDTRADMALALKNIRSVDPPRPSKKRKGVNGDLDAIVLKAMEKDPRRRYGTASELAQDVAAWLEGRPIMARSDSSLYVLYKLATRHSFETLIVATVLIIMVSFCAISLDQYRQARKAIAAQISSDQATVEARKAANAATQFELLAPTRRLYLQWFLLEWHQGRLDEARRVRDHAAIGSAEYTAMTFLLDDAYTLDRLLADLPADAAPLAYFVAAERELKAGRNSKAIEFYQRSLQAPGSRWFPSAVQARLNQLQSATSKPAELSQSSRQEVTP
jgi:hypothetical protein